MNHATVIPSSIDTFYNDYISGMDSMPLENPVEPAAEQGIAVDSANAVDTTAANNLNQGTNSNQGTDIVIENQGTDNQTENQGTVEFPSFLDSQWVPPQDAKPEWYQENYTKLASSIGSEDFVKTITETYAQQLLQTEQDVDEAMKMYRAHKAGDVSFLRQHFPEALASIGVSPILSDTEIESEIEGTLKTEFGENYADLYEAKDIVKPSSVSAKIFARQQELYKQWQSENQIRQSKLESYKEQGTQTQTIPNGEPNPEYIDNQYNTYFKDMPRDKFDEMLDQIREGVSSKWGLKEISRVLTYEQDIAKAKEDGIREGKEAVLRDIKNAGNTRNPQQIQPAIPGAGASVWKDAQKEAERNIFMY